MDRAYLYVWRRGNEPPLIGINAEGAKEHGGVGGNVYLVESGKEGFGKNRRRHADER